MKIQIKYLLLMAVIGAMVSGLFISCSKDNDVEIDNDDPKPVTSPEPTIKFAIITENGYIPSREPLPNLIVAKSEGDTIFLPMVMFEEGATCSLQKPFPIYGYLLNDLYPEAYKRWLNSYSNAGLICCRWYDSTPSDNREYFNIDIEQIGKNLWEGDGFKIDKIWNGNLYGIQITIPANPIATTRVIAFCWGYDDKDYVLYSSWGDFGIYQEGRK